MSTNKEILESIKKINIALAATLTEAEHNNFSEFYKESIKLSALGIFEKAQLLSKNIHSEANKPVTEIKIIKQENIEPVLENNKISIIPEPLIAPIEIKPVVETITESKPFVEPQKPELEIPKSNPPKNQPIAKGEEEEDKSLNARIAKDQQPIINIADKMKDTPIKELVKAISISKKFEFINDLFKGKAEVYKECLLNIEKGNSYEEAVKYLETNIVEPYQWSDNEKLAAEFFALVKRRFL